jgi:hypothetical protein
MGSSIITDILPLGLVKTTIVLKLATEVTAFKLSLEYSFFSRYILN